MSFKVIVGHKGDSVKLGMTIIATYLLFCDDLKGKVASSLLLEGNMFSREMSCDATLCEMRLDL